MMNLTKANMSPSTRKQTLPGNLTLPHGATSAWVFVSVQDSKPAFSLSYCRDLNNSYCGNWYTGGIAWEFDQAYPDNLRITFILLPGVTLISSPSQFITLETPVRVFGQQLQSCMVAPEASSDAFFVQTELGSHDPVIVVTPIT